MSTISKVFTVLNVVLALFLLGVVASLLANTEDFKRQLEVAEADAAAEIEKRDGTISELDATKSNQEGELRNLRTKIDNLESDNATLTADNETKQNTNDELRASFDNLSSSLGSLQGQLAEFQGRSSDLEEKNDELRETARQAQQGQMEAEDDRARLERDLASARSDTEDALRRLDSAGLEIERFEAERASLVATGLNIDQLISGIYKKIDGQVASVSETTGIVVLNVGADQGVEIGYPFDVYRGNDYIGRVIVNEVQPKTSIARITLRNDRGFEFRNLDSATTKFN